MISTRLAQRSEARLAKVHSDLRKIVELAQRRCPIAFIVVEGLRTAERQAELVKAGASQTMKSRHLTGHAIDLAPVADGQVRWDWPLFHPIAAAMKQAAAELQIALEWGGDWKRFKDGPHFQLSWAAYPADKEA
jgi:peptidoglycan LD-endopeptidase CwlK